MDTEEEIRTLKKEVTEAKGDITKLQMLSPTQHKLIRRYMWRVIWPTGIAASVITFLIGFLLREGAEKMAAATAIKDAYNQAFPQIATSMREIATAQAGASAAKDAVAKSAAEIETARAGASAAKDEALKAKAEIDAIKVRARDAIEGLKSQADQVQGVAEALKKGDDLAQSIKVNLAKDEIFRGQLADRLAEMLIEGEGTLEGISTASATIVCAKASSVIVSVQVEARANPTNFRSELTTQILLNGAIVNTERQRQGPASEHSKEVVMTTILPLAAGTSKLEVKSTGDEVGPAKITARYIVLKAKREQGTR